MKITRVGLDIAKQVLQVHGVDEHDKSRVSKKLARAKVLEFFAQLPACVIGIEACGGAHYWGRELTGYMEWHLERYAEYLRGKEEASRDDPINN